MKAAASKPTLAKASSKTSLDANNVVHLGEVVGPLGSVTIYDDGSYTRTEIINEGLVQFNVEFPLDKNICEIKLHVEFKKAEGGRRRIFRGGGGGGTVVIGG